jgi:hypothetical protein
MSRKSESKSYRGVSGAGNRQLLVTFRRIGATRAVTLLLSVVLAGCATSSPSSSTTPGGGAQVGSPAPSSATAPTPSPANVVTVSTCCRATLPATWTAPTLIANGLYGASDSQGTLSTTWQVVGSAHRCPPEPPALLSSLVSPTHPSGDVITAVDSILVDGKHVAAYVTAPSAATPRAYEFVNADAVLGANCVDLGAAEYGVASPSNLQALLQILATTRPMEYPLQS